MTSKRVRRRLRRLRHGARAVVVRPVMAIALFVIPRLYILYMKLVYATSRVHLNNFPDLHDILRKHDGAVGLLWHEEVFSVAYGYAYAGFRPHTLASFGDAGDIVTRMLELCGFVVFRGGSSSHRSRRRAQVVRDMTRHMESHREVLYGITVDGSEGPPYRMKGGGVLIARETGRPLVLARTWYRRYLRLPTWDRMAIPLPFNEIAYYLRGPYPVPESARTPDGLQGFLLRLEDDLIDLAADSYRTFHQPLPNNLMKRDKGDVPTST